MKLLYFDLETTGVRYWKDGIHQISGCIDINGKIEEWFDLKVQPNPKAEISDEALAVSGVSREDLVKYMPFKEGYRQVTAILSKYVDRIDKKDKMFLVGYNCAYFDTPFFRAMFVQNGDEYFGSYFYSASLDVMVLAAQYLVTERVEMKDFKLGTVAAHMGIDVDPSKQHDARYDVEIMRELHRRVIAPFVKYKVEKRTSIPVKKEPGKIVRTKDGLKVGRTYNRNEAVNGKVPVYLMSNLLDPEWRDLAQIITHAKWSTEAILCSPETLSILGFID